MDRFRNGDHVEVVDDRHPLLGRRGRVIQVRDADGCGRVVIERGLKDHECIVLEGVRFPDQTFLFPGHCRKLRG